MQTRDRVIEEFSQKTSGLYSDTMGNFKKRAADLIVEGSGWGENVMIHEKELDLQLRTLIKNTREREIDKL